jgi:hypothetical protein
MRPPLTREQIVEAAGEAVAIGNPASPEAMLALLRRLYAIGRADLPLGRLVEGHVDALQIVARYGTAAQAALAGEAARAGRLFGVWNADRPAAPAVLDGEHLSGGKAFASGAGLVTDALISVDVAGGRQLLLVDLDHAPPTIDLDWWRVTGMQRSATHVATWAGQPLAAAARIGAPGDYVREPWFSGGAIRFAAVQAGGIAALVDGARDHLVAVGRSEDPLQRARLADLYGAAQAAADAVRRAGLGWSAANIDGTLARVAAARVAVVQAGEEALRLCAAAVGLQAMFVDHPLAEAMRDLDVYLRQPAPDAQRLVAGRAVADGVLVPAL